MSESTFYFNPLALLSFSSFLIMMVLALVLWLRYYSDQTKYVILLFIANSIYSLFYSFEISFQTIEEISWYYHMEYFGIPFLASIYLLFAMQFSGKGKWLTGRVILGVNLIPLITMALVFTNQWHHLYYSRESMNLSGPFPVFAFVPGIWYFIHQGYTILAMLFSLFMLSLMLKNSSTIYHNQVILIILGTLFPFLGYIAYQMHLIPFGIDPVSSTFALTGIFVYIALVKYRLFDLLPIARTRLFEKTDDKVLVFDIADRLIDYNDSAGELFGFSKKDMGKSSVELLAAWPEILAYTNGKESGNIQLH
ncbi:MAG: hypothetical protein LWW85_07355, partial [Marinilabiliales bacterium]|nr:hypothetical protein [Marinilabiliales bacterium]